jgi:hypothetical protein
MKNKKMMSWLLLKLKTFIMRKIQKSLKKLLVSNTILQEKGAALGQSICKMSLENFRMPESKQVLKTKQNKAK